MHDTDPGIRIDTLTQINVILFKRLANAFEDTDTMPTIRLPSRKPRRLTEDDPTPVVNCRPILYPW